DCQPTVTRGVRLAGRLGTYRCRRSAEVCDSGRAMLLASRPKSNHSPCGGGGRWAINTRRKLSRSMHPSSKASYKLGHSRSKKGDSDRWAKRLAVVSVARASTVLNKASAARRKQL